MKIQILIAALFVSTYAIAETEPPFFPVLQFDGKVSLPAPTQVVRLDLKNPSNSRAAEYRATFEGTTTSWLPIATEIDLPLQVTPQFLGPHFFAVQFRDAQQKPSAWLKTYFEVLPFDYLQKPIPAVASGAGCVRSPYDHARIERAFQLTLPTALRYEIRYATCKNTAGPADRCEVKVDELAKAPWKSFDASRPLKISEEVLPNFYCGTVRVIAQIRDNLGFETAVFMLPK